MWQPWVKENARLKYVGIVDALEDDIKNGLVARGERLPSQRVIAQAIGVDLTTVTRAFNEARRRNLVDASPGRGTFVRKGFEVGGVVSQRQPFVDLGMNTPPQLESMDFRKHFAQGMSDILSHAGGMLNLQYQDSSGSDFDRKVAAGWLQPRIENVDPDRILVTAGAQTALYAICNLLLQPGDVLVAGDMTYPGLKAIAVQMGLHLLGLSMDCHGIVPDAFEKACVENAPKAIYLVPNIDNPTTATLPDDRRADLVRLARKYGVTILEDDPYWPLLKTKTTALASLGPDITWHIATLSKCATPALRVAYVVAPGTAQARQLAAILRATVLMPPPLMCALASRWIAEGLLAKIIGQIRAENVARQTLAAQYLGPAIAADRNGHHAWLHLPDHWQADGFARQAEWAGVAVVPASAFAVGPNTTNAVRISLGVTPDRTILENGLALLARLLAPGMSSIKTIV
ncbi:PLP-dependent aminotransferase family protein [uncultured Thalassospira sp.]|uniref:aminotransferase-like domain-containing protein n=1 Tax=uncultured Thalassospira sp. TaxID=404382 RepID=UPI0030D9CE06